MREGKDREEEKKKERKEKTEDRIRDHLCGLYETLSSNCDFGSPNGYRNRPALMCLNSLESYPDNIRCWLCKDELFPVLVNKNFYLALCRGKGTKKDAFRRSYRDLQSWVEGFRAKLSELNRQDTMGEASAAQ